MPSIALVAPKRPPMPIVAPGAGSSLPDIAAYKLATQWISVLKHDGDAADMRFEKFLMGPQGSFGGTPKAQIKWYSRATNALGSSIVKSAFQGANRARFSAVIDYILVGPSFNSNEDALNLWILVTRVVIFKEGPRSLTRFGERTAVAFSKHAIMRLIQRGSVHDVEELRKALRHIWNRVADAELMTSSRRKKVKGEQWLVPIEPMDDGERLVVVMRGPSIDQPEDYCYITTILPWSMIRAEKRPALLELDDFLRRHRLEESMELRSTYERLFDAVRSE